MFFGTLPSLIWSRRRGRTAVHAGVLKAGAPPFCILMIFKRDFAAVRLAFPYFGGNISRVTGAASPPSPRALRFHYPALFHVERPIGLPERLWAGSQGGKD